MGQPQTKNLPQGNRKATYGPGKVFANMYLTRELIDKIYLKTCTTKHEKRLETWTKDLSRHFSQKTQNDQEINKRGSLSLFFLFPLLC